MKRVINATTKIEPNIDYDYLNSIGVDIYESPSGAGWRLCTSDGTKLNVTITQMNGRWFVSDEDNEFSVTSTDLTDAIASLDTKVCAPLQ